MQLADNGLNWEVEGPIACFSGALMIFHLPSSSGGPISSSLLYSTMAASSRKSL
jgi:hypothetical protein